jgi:aspartate carbamoyltransferase catalytic subunit
MLARQQSFSQKRETLIDTVNNILMKVDMVVMRRANPGAAFFIEKKPL